MKTIPKEMNRNYRKRLITRNMIVTLKEKTALIVALLIITAAIFGADVAKSYKVDGTIPIEWYNEWIESYPYSGLVKPVFNAAQARKQTYLFLKEKISERYANATKPYEVYRVSDTDAWYVRGGYQTFGSAAFVCVIFEGKTGQVLSLYATR